MTEDLKPNYPIGPLTPHLVCDGADAAMDFYRAAFGGEVMFRLAGPDGRIMNACMRINGGTIMLVDEFPEMCSSPRALKGSPVSLHLMVDDVDAWTARAVDAGAKVIMPVDDMFWGDRYGVIEDPFGHRWSIATPQRRLSQAEIEEGMHEAIRRHMQANPA